MKARSLILVLLFCTLLLSKLCAQNAINASGGENIGSGGTVSFTIGQIIYSPQTGSNGSVSFGVQQPYEISVINGIEETYITLECEIFPNPTTDYIILKIENPDNKRLLYILFDSEGKLIDQKKISENETSISMANPVSSVYFLKVTDNTKNLKTFKILKK